MTTLQSIRITPAPGVPPGIDYRSYRKDWPELRLNMAAARQHMSGRARAITVAVVDSGIPDDDLRRPDPDRDDDGHATLLARTIRGPAREHGNVAVDLHAIKAFSAQGWPSPDPCANAIRQTADLKPKVIVLAWDTGHTTPALEKAIRDTKDAVIVVAAGNWSLDNDLHRNWPANYGEMPHVITVMATDEHDERASYSSWGPKSVYIAAPGFAKVDTPAPTNPLRIAGSLRDSYQEFRGTSAATAHVALLAALVRAKHPQWTPQQVKKHIGDNAREVPALKKLCATSGIADFEAALG